MTRFHDCLHQVRVKQCVALAQELSHMQKGQAFPDFRFSRAQVPMNLKMAQGLDLKQSELQAMLKNNKKYRQMKWFQQDAGTAPGRLKAKTKAIAFHCFCITKHTH